MALLFSNEILDSVKNELQCATKSVQIITAYCKESSFKRLNDYISSDIKEKRLLVRFRMDDILKGSSDFSIIEVGMDLGWQVYVRFDLHAKTYIVDNKRGLVGSANATNSGLGIGKNGNMEMATLVDIEPQDIEKVNKLFNDAILVNKEILGKMKSQLPEKTSSQVNDKCSWDISITSLFNPKIETIFSYEFPDDFELNEGEYFPFMDETYNGDLRLFKESFRWSTAYLWLLHVLKDNNGELYFGALSVKLHDALVSDPKPYRKDVKTMLANLLKLVQELDMEEIEIDQPDYSQRIRLK